MSAQRPLIHPRDELVDTLLRIYRYRMTTTSGGNLSILDEGGDLWITPARVDKGALRGEDIVRVGADGRSDGRHKPSSEYPFHRAIYAARPDVRAILHAHPVALVAFSTCRAMPNVAMFPQAAHVCGTVAYAAYALPGSAALGQAIAAAFAAGAACVMLENHGVVVAGQNMAEAFARFETLEFCAKTQIKSHALGTARSLTPRQLARAAEFRATMTAFRPGPAGSGERDARRQVVDFVRRGYRQRLMTSTEGTLSARVDGDAFVITPYGVDRATVDLDDLVLIRGDQVEEGKTPSRAAGVHRAIYRRHKSIRAIANGMPVNASAFAVTGTTLETRTIPESYILLRDVPTIPFDLRFDDPDAVADLVTPRRPVALIENDGVLVLGQSVLDAFDRLEVMESTAEALIHSRCIGPLCPMDDSAIRELAHAFPTAG